MADTDTRTTLVQESDTDVGDGTYVPPMLLVVFGLPIFLVLIWFFLRFTAPDRFGRVDRDWVDRQAGGDDPAPDEHDEASEEESDPDL